MTWANEVTFTTAPSPRASIEGTAAAINARGVQKLSSNASRPASLSPTRHCDPPTPPPALLTRMSIRPSASCASSASSAPLPRCPRSMTWTEGFTAPAATNSSARLSKRSPRRAAMARRAPREARTRANSLPIPLDAPVTRAVRSRTSNRLATIPRATLRCSWDTVKMPRTRRDLEREAKIDEVLEVAEDQLLAGGFESLSVAGVARELGIAQNAVYWYFPSRDHLFVATLERILARVLTTGTSPSHDQGPAVLV